MIHTQGAVLGPVSDGGFCALKQVGVHDVKLLEMVPGVRFSKRWGKYYIPSNMLPPRSLGALKQRQAPSGLVLRPYQNHAVSFIERSVRGCIVALDMGLGKTVVVLQWLHEHPEMRPFLVCGPVIAEGSWCGEEGDPAKHYGMDVRALRTRSPDSEKMGEVGAEDTPDGYYMTYEVVDDWNLWISEVMKPKAIIMDEAHDLRNPRRKTAKAVKGESKGGHVKKRIALTGTPVINTVSDLWNVLDIVQPGQWGAWVTHEGYKTSFRSRYLGAHLDSNGWWKDEGETNVDELRARLDNTLLRFSRFEVRGDLPDMGRRVIDLAPASLEPEAYKEYREAATSIYKALKMQNMAKAAEARGAEPVMPSVLLDMEKGAAEPRRLGAMAQKLSWSKRKLAVDHALAMARAMPSKKLVVFTYYQETAKYIAKALKREKQLVFGPVTGGTGSLRRLALAQQFKTVQDDLGKKCSFYVATIKAAGQALNPLSAAGGALFVDLYWVPYLFLQAEARVHREGQLAGEVWFDYLVLRKSIDTIMWEHLKAKAKAIEAGVRDGEALKFCEELGGRSEKEGQQALMDDLAGLDEVEWELL